MIPMGPIPPALKPFDRLVQGPVRGRPDPTPKLAIGLPALFTYPIREWSRPGSGGFLKHSEIPYSVVLTEMKKPDSCRIYRRSHLF